MIDPTAYLGTCPYEHLFIGFMCADVKRPCVLDKGHEGNHVVKEPKENRPMEVPRQ